MKEAMTPLVTPCGENSEVETQKRSPAMVQRLKLEKATLGTEFQTRVSNHWLLDAGRQLDERSLENCAPKIQESHSQRAGRNGNVGYARQLRPVPPQLQRWEHTGRGADAPDKRNGILLGDHNFLRRWSSRLEKAKNTHFLMDLEGVCRRPTKLARIPSGRRGCKVCCAMSLGPTVTQAALRAATEVQAVVTIVKHGRVMFTLEWAGAGESVESLEENSIPLHGARRQLPSRRRGQS